MAGNLSAISNLAGTASIIWLLILVFVRLLKITQISRDRQDLTPPSTDVDTQTCRLTRVLIRAFVLDCSVDSTAAAVGVIDNTH
jgi:hypothetical protein